MIGCGPCIHFTTAVNPESDVRFLFAVPADLLGFMLAASVVVTDTIIDIGSRERGD